MNEEIPEIQNLLKFLTNNTETPVRLELSDIPGSKPSGATLLEKIVLACIIFFQITHCHIWAPDANFSPGEGLILNRIIALVPVNQANIAALEWRTNPAHRQIRNCVKFKIIFLQNLLKF